MWSGPIAMTRLTCCEHEHERMRVVRVLRRHQMFCACKQYFIPALQCHIKTVRNGTHRASVHTISLQCDTRERQCHTCSKHAHALIEEIVARRNSVHTAKTRMTAWGSGVSSLTGVAADKNENVLRWAQESARSICVNVSGHN